MTKIFRIPNYLIIQKSSKSLNYFPHLHMMSWNFLLFHKANMFNERVVRKIFNYRLCTDLYADWKFHQYDINYSLKTFTAENQLNFPNVKLLVFLFDVNKHNKKQIRRKRLLTILYGSACIRIWFLKAFSIFSSRLNNFAPNI